MRRSTLVLAVLVAATALLRRRSTARRAEQDLWAEAGKTPDLR